MSTLKSLFDKISKQPERSSVYSPLAPGEFRLLRLQGTRSSSEPLTCNLFTTPLSEAGVRFEALSYVWGHDNPNRRIHLNDSHFYIRSNLEAALRALANNLAREDQTGGPATKVLWIDAMCINQDDNTEKSNQVQKMRTIYQKAHRVLIWITSPGAAGEPRRTQERTASALRNFTRYHKAGVGARELAQYLDNPEEKKEFKLVPRGLENWGDIVEHGEKGGYWPTLVRFYDQDWWRRVWVRQEIAMSKRASVLFGEFVVDWEDVATVSHWLSVFKTDLDDKTIYWGGTHRSGAYSGEDLQFFRRTLQKGGSLDFQSMLIHARSCEATNPLDRVFAILGMVQNHIDMPIDYHMSAAEVAKQAFQRLAVLNGGLDALIFCQNPFRQGGIPSWAPNIYSEFIAQPSRLSGREESLYRASMDSQVDYSFAADGSMLSISVGMFDSVKFLSESFLRPRVDLDRAMRILRTEAFAWLGTTSDSVKYEQLLRVLTRDQNTQGQRLISGVESLNWGRFFRFEHMDVGAATEFQYLTKALKPFSTPADDAEIKAWLRLMSESIGNRRLVMTKGGKLGLVPIEAQELDILCILASVDVPLLLRKIDADTYILIGEAFIHGVMDGEVITPVVGNDDIAVDWQDIHLL